MPTQFEFPVSCVQLRVLAASVMIINQLPLNIISMLNCNHDEQIAHNNQRQYRPYAGLTHPMDTRQYRPEKDPANWHVGLPPCPCCMYDSTCRAAALCCATCAVHGAMSAYHTQLKARSIKHTLCIHHLPCMPPSYHCHDDKIHRACRHPSQLAAVCKARAGAS